MAVDWPRELRHSWPLLRAASSTEVTTSPLPLIIERDPVRAAVDGAGSRHLLVPIGDDNDVRGDDGDGALSVRLRTFTFSRVPLRYVDIVCIRPDLFDQFDEVLVDVLSAIASSPGSAARTAVEVVAKWRALLGIRRGQLLTLVARLSLFAELTVLDIVSRDQTLEAQWWRGPLREPHDIVQPDRAFEVKAVGASSSAVEIHGLRQLDPPGVPLALALVSISEGEDGTPLPDLVDRVLARVSDRGEAIRRLAAAGYSLSDADRYTELFRVDDIGVVTVTSAVPRITAESFGASGPPVGVDGVVYRVGLGSLGGFAVRGEAELRSFARGAS